MFMKEHAAARKLCPVFVPRPWYFWERILGIGRPLPTCIGSACMAWRWARFDPETGQKVEKPNSGYCGMAGKP
jgi:hypothetical protein